MEPFQNGTVVDYNRTRALIGGEGVRDLAMALVSEKCSFQFGI
jgi:hypothetical protein